MKSIVVIAPALGLLLTGINLTVKLGSGERKWRVGIRSRSPACNES